MALPGTRNKKGGVQTRESLFCKSIYVDLLKVLCVADKVHALQRGA